MGPAPGAGAGAGRHGGGGLRAHDPGHRPMVGGDPEQHGLHPAQRSDIPPVRRECWDSGERTGSGHPQPTGVASRLGARTAETGGHRPGDIGRGGAFQHHRRTAAQPVAGDAEDLGSLQFPAGPGEERDDSDAGPGCWAWLLGRWPAALAPWRRAWGWR